MKIRSEDIAFTREEMTGCKKCERLNPPDRLNCLYCGSELEVSPDRLKLIRPVIRELESWEPGLNVIVSVNPKLAENISADVARSTGLRQEDAAAILSTGRPLPVARVGSQRDAELMSTALISIGCTSAILSDEELGPQRQPSRLRAIEFKGSSLTLVEFNNGVQTTVSHEDIVLIVAGIVSSSQTEQLEKKRRGKETKVLEEVETETDEPVLDIYERSDTSGHRISLSGFDFSCLGPDKGYIASENLRRLTVRLRDFAPQARYSDDHLRLRRLIAAVWPPESRRDARGMQRSGFAKFEYGSRITSSNLSQFNRFSRLERHSL